MSNVSATIRQNAIVAAIDELNPETDFTQSGNPEVKALEAVLGFDIGAEERDAAWQAAQEKKKAEAKAAKAAQEEKEKAARSTSAAVTIDRILPDLRKKGVKI